MARCPFRSWRAEPERREHAGGVPGVAAAGGGDVRRAGEFEDRDGQVPQGGHDLGSVAGADLGGVFAVGEVADVVDGFYLPVAADPPGELAGSGLAGGQAGDRVDRDRLPFLRAG